MIDPLRDKLLSLEEAARLIQTSEPVTAGKLWRWSREGVRGHKLAVVAVGRDLHTTEAALRHFLNQIQEPATAAT